MFSTNNRSHMIFQYFIFNMFLSIACHGGVLCRLLVFSWYSHMYALHVNCCHTEDDPVGCNSWHCRWLRALHTLRLRIPRFQTSVCYLWIQVCCHGCRFEGHSLSRHTCWNYYMKAFQSRLVLTHITISSHQDIKYNAWETILIAYMFKSKIRWFAVIQL